MAAMMIFLCFFHNFVMFLLISILHPCRSLRLVNLHAHMMAKSLQETLAKIRVAPRMAASSKHPQVVDDAHQMMAGPDAQTAVLGQTVAADPGAGKDHVGVGRADLDRLDDLDQINAVSLREAAPFVEEREDRRPVGVLDDLSLSMGRSRTVRGNRLGGRSCILAFWDSAYDSAPSSFCKSRPATRAIKSLLSEYARIVCHRKLR